MKRLTQAERMLLDEGRALIVHCAACDDEHYLSDLPRPMHEVVLITRRFRCPNDKAHKLLMGPLPASPIPSHHGVSK